LIHGADIRVSNRYLATTRRNVEQTKLDNLRVAILVAEGFEEVEMMKPREALEAAGAQTVLVSPERDKVTAFNHHDKSTAYPVQLPLDNALPEDFDALLLPGGALNPDRLRTNPIAVEFVRAFFDDGKPVAAICHAAWTLVEADVVAGRTLTSWPSLKTDLRNAGAEWVDREVVEDGNLVTSRKPDDLPAFNAKMLESFARSVSRSAA
jgi:protease I